MGQNSARDIWPYINLRLGNGPPLFPSNLTVDNTDATTKRARELPALSNNQDVQMLMFDQAVGGQPMPFAIGTGPWAYLRLISDAKADRKVKPTDDGAPMSYDVVYSIKRNGVDYPMAFVVTYTSKSKQLTALPGWFFKAQP